MNREILSHWLENVLRSMFGEVSSEGMARTLAGAEEASALILSDFLRAHPLERWKDGDCFARVLQTDAPFQATLLYRISHVLFLKDPSDAMLDLLAYVMRSRTGIEVYYSSLIGEGFRILHGSGLVLGPRHRIGQMEITAKMPDWDSADSIVRRNSWRLETIAFSLPEPEFWENSKLEMM